MKKKYKGYFKKPTRTFVDVKYRKVKENPPVEEWVKTYIKYLTNCRK